MGDIFGKHDPAVADGTFKAIDEGSTTEQIEERLTQAEQEIVRAGLVTPKEAHEILVRFCHSHFNGRLGESGKERARISIPADPTRDDDIRMSAFIEHANLSMRSRDEVWTQAKQEERAGCILLLHAHGHPAAARLLQERHDAQVPERFMILAELREEARRANERLRDIGRRFQALARELGL